MLHGLLFIALLFLIIMAIVVMLAVRFFWSAIVRMRDMIQRIMELAPTAMEVRTIRAAEAANIRSLMVAVVRHPHPAAHLLHHPPAGLPQEPVSRPPAVAAHRHLPARPSSTTAIRSRSGERFSPRMKANMLISRKAEQKRQISILYIYMNRNVEASRRGVCMRRSVIYIHIYN